MSNIKCQMSNVNKIKPYVGAYLQRFSNRIVIFDAYILIANKMQTLYYRFRMHTKTLPEAQRTQGIESITWIMFLAEKNHSSYGLNTLGPLCLWQCFSV